MPPMPVSEDATCVYGLATGTAYPFETGYRWAHPLDSHVDSLGLDKMAATLATQQLEL